MKTKSKQRFKSAVSILLMLAVVITGAFAYFTATDSKKNVFTIGNVDIVLHEDDWTEPDENGDSQHIDGDNINVLPGDKISKAPYIENTGDNNAWVYMTIGIPTIQRDTSRADDLAISFTNTNIPVEAYALQEGYGNVDGSQAMWDAYFADKSDDKFGTAVTDSSALLNRVELFNLPDIDSGWTQLGEVFKSEDGFNYYVFAYNDVIEPTSNTTPVIEWVQLNPALTQNDDVLFNPDAASVAYFVKNDIGESEAQEIYGAQADYEYAGAIELDYVPEQDDAYYVSNADALLTFNATSSQWEVETTEDNPVDADLIPDTILNKTATVIDPQADPDPNHIAPVAGDEWEDDDYVYKYRYTHNGTDWTFASSAEWSARVKDTTKTSYGPMKNEIWGKKVNYASATFRDCTNLIEAPKLSVNLKDASYAFKNCTSLKTVNKLPQKLNYMTNTFEDCISLEQAPTIPDSVTTLEWTFRNCTSLISAPEIPNSVKNMNATFLACSLLINTPTIPNSVTSMSSTFTNCTSLVNPPDLSQAISVTNMTYTFSGCEKLEKAPEIPATVTDMYEAFRGCKSLKIAPEIPEKVRDIRGTFKGCSSLTTPPSRIPNSVVMMDTTFSDCISLATIPDMSDATSVTRLYYTFDSTKITETPDMSNMTSLLDMTGAFARCSSLTTANSLPPNATNMYGTFYQCKNLTGTIRLPASVKIDPNKYLSGLRTCFDDTVKPITLEYHSVQEKDVKYLPKNVTKVCIDA